MATVLLSIAAEDQRTFLADQLAADGHAAVPAGRYAEAVFGAQTEIITAAIVDIGLPEHGALRLLREVRAATHHDLPADLPMLAVMPSESGELEPLRTFDAGADDVCRQPVGYPELRCRLEALLRRCTATDSSARRRRVGTLTLDLFARTAEVDGRFVDLSRLEFDLLAVLSRDPSRVYEKSELLREVWGMPPEVSTRTLDSHACRLRAKLNAGNGMSYISTRWGVGYSLLPPH